MRRLGYLALLAWPTLVAARGLEGAWRHAWPLEVVVPAERLLRRGNEA
ncbi:hypothetical protein [Halomonas sp. PBN3]|nr:hypothetical protein [Halomonas sp. PBN3]ERS83454.1 hypothetical protein Q671_11230 [Halomonas sp. PBN3]